MPDEQTMKPREILARSAEHWLGPGDVKQVEPLADAQLAALEAAGYVVVKADRFERLRQRASMTPRNPDIADDILHPGDLGAWPGQEGQDNG
jgi:hypothetical protein